MKDKSKEASGDVAIESQSADTGKPPKSKLPPNLQTKRGASPSSAASGEPKIEAPPAEDRKADFSSLLGRIKERVAGDTPDDAEPTKPKPKRKKTTKAQQSELQDAARILLTPLLIFAVGQSLGEVCAPTKDEADAFVDPMARIVARHVPIPEHLSADIIDLLAMTAAGVVWYSRVHPDLPWHSDNGRGPKPGENDRGPVPSRKVDQKTKENVPRPAGAGITVDELLDREELLDER